MKSKDLEKLCVEAQNLLSAIEDYKAFYKRLDEITEQLIGHDLSKYGLAVVDNYTEKNNQWKSVAFRRFELEKLAVTSVRHGNGPFKVRRVK